MRKIGSKIVFSKIVLMLVCLSLLGASAPAFAMGKKPKPPAGDPNLDIHPFIFPRSAFAPSLADDADGDCMSDEAEHALAMHFRPYFIFDSRENARRPEEPINLYRVRTGLKAPNCGTVPQKLRLIFAHLYKNDGGFATSLVCRRNTHKGDNQAVIFETTVSPDGTTFRLSMAKIGDNTWPQSRIFFYENHHPAVYLSAGKHHEYVDTKWNGAGYPYFYYGCREGVNAAGLRRLAILESPFAPRGHNNVGEFSQHPDSNFVNDLTLFGYPGEQAWGETPFCGGYPGGCSSKDTSSMRGVWGD